MESSQLAKRSALNRIEKCFRAEGFRQIRRAP